MTDDTVQSALGEQVRKLVGALPKNTAPDLIWPMLDELGLERALVSEGAGGHGLDWPDLGDALRAWGSAAAPVDLASTLLAAWSLDQAGIPLPDGPLQLEAEARGVLASRPDAWRVVVGGPNDETVALLDPAGAHVSQGVLQPDRLQSALAVLLASQIAGALDAALSLSIDYATTRTQFGRPIAKFQAVQQLAAGLAMETAAAGAAADFGLRRFSGNPRLAAAVAKSRTSKAATAGAALAHQIHGAIGVTEEHDLHRLTRALWRWRDQTGGEHGWSRALGETVARQAAPNLWAWLTETLDGRDVVR